MHGPGAPVNRSRGHCAGTADDFTQVGWLRLSAYALFRLSHDLGLNQGCGRVSGCLGNRRRYARRPSRWPDAARYPGRPGGNALRWLVSAQVGAGLAGVGGNGAMAGAAALFAVEGVASRPRPGRQLPAGAPLPQCGAHPESQEAECRQHGVKSDDKHQARREKTEGGRWCCGRTGRDRGCRRPTQQRLRWSGSRLPRRRPWPAAGGGPGRADAPARLRPARWGGRR
jgi:hypothetical protein